MAAACRCPLGQQPFTPPITRPDPVPNHYGLYWGNPFSSLPDHLKLGRVCVISNIYPATCPKGHGSSPSAARFLQGFPYPAGKRKQKGNKGDPPRTVCASRPGPPASPSRQPPWTPRRAPPPPPSHPSLATPLPLVGGGGLPKHPSSDVVVATAISILSRPVWPPSTSGTHSHPLLLPPISASKRATKENQNRNKNNMNTRTDQPPPAPYSSISSGGGSIPSLTPASPTSYFPWATGASTSGGSTSRDSTAPFILLSQRWGGSDFHTLADWRAPHLWTQASACTPWGPP